MAVAQRTAVGTVASLWRYPVKSMIGEELNSSVVTERGLAGDRAYAIVDPATGKIGSAKNPKKWPNLFECHARFVEPPAEGGVPAVWITLPDGTIARSDQPDVAEVLSKVVGREVVLATTAPDKPVLEEYWPDIEGLAHREEVTDEGIAALAPPGTFFDAAAIHLVTTATLNALRAAYPPGRFEVRRFRPNLVVATNQEGFVENDWVGAELAIGDEVRVKVVVPCPRCVMTTLPQSDLPHDSGILRTAARENNIPVANLGKMPSVGVYATVERGGTVRRGDQLTLAT